MTRLFAFMSAAWLQKLATSHFAEVLFGHVWFDLHMNVQRTATTRAACLPSPSCCQPRRQCCYGDLLEVFLTFKSKSALIAHLDRPSLTTVRQVPTPPEPMQFSNLTCPRSLARSFPNIWGTRTTVSFAWSLHFCSAPAGAQQRSRSKRTAAAADALAVGGVCSSSSCW